MYKTLCEYVYEPVGCSSNPCQYDGNCTELVNGYNCTCTTGYTGVNCETNINECSSAPCKNGGYCYDQINKYTCLCMVGFNGTHCENETNVCTDDSLGSYCSSIAGRFCPFSNTCFKRHNFNARYEDTVKYCQNSAPQGYRGRLPHMPNIRIQRYAFWACPSFCWAGAYSSKAWPLKPAVRSEWGWIDHFLNGTDIYTPVTEDARLLIVDQRARCSVMWYGRITDHPCSSRTRVFCEYLKEDGNPCDVNECISGPCQNGGNCSDELNGYNCTCPAGYNGTHCEIDTDNCNSEPCQNGGTCEDGVNKAYICFCPVGYHGTHCEHPGLSPCTLPSYDLVRRWYELVPEKSDRLPVYNVVGKHQCQGPRILCAKTCTDGCQMFAYNDKENSCVTYAEGVDQIEYESAEGFEIWTKL